MGGNPVTIPDAVLSLASNGHLVVEMKEDSVRKGAATATSGSFISTDPKELIVAGMVLRPGGSVVNVVGTPMSMAEAGEIFVGKVDPPRLSSIFTNLAKNEMNPSGIAGGFSVGGSTTVAGHVSTRIPSALKVGGVTLYPGRIGATISGTSISFAKSGSLVVGRETLKLPEPPLSAFTTNGLVFSADLPGLLVDGTTITPGGSAIILSGTPIRLDAMGDLVIGSRSTGLPTSAPSKFTVDGHVFEGSPSVLLVDGNTLVAGGAAITLSGTPIIPDTSGTLRLGTSEIPLTPTGSTRSSSEGLGENGSPEAFLGHAGEKWQVPSRLSLIALIGLSLWLREVI